MINIAALTNADIGREVRYKTFGALEYGRITSWNDKFVFVRYYLKISGDKQIPRTGDTSEATDPNDLEF